MSESVCPECGEGFDRSAVTDCRLDSTGLEEGRALIYGGVNGEPGLHLHGVIVASLDYPNALTVRASVRRWARTAWRRFRYRVRHSRTWPLA